MLPPTHPDLDHALPSGNEGERPRSFTSRGDIVDHDGPYVAYAPVSGRDRRGASTLRTSPVVDGPRNQVQAGVGDKLLVGARLQALRRALGVHPVRLRPLPWRGATTGRPGYRQLDRPLCVTLLVGALEPSTGPLAVAAYTRPCVSKCR
jgi:hypothetical protein